MGNIFSSGSNTWDIQLHTQGGELIKINAHYERNEPQTIRILGVVSLECTVEVNNSAIEIDGQGHRVTIKGENNVIRVEGSDVCVRVEGELNKIAGKGTGTQLFTNNVVTVRDIDITKKDSCTAADAPPCLALLEDDGNGSDGTPSTTNNTKERIRITYKSRANGGGGDNASSTGSTSNNADLHISPFGEQEKGGVKRGADDSNDDDNNDSDTKRSRND